MQKRIDRFLLVSVLTGLTFALLFIFKSWDDNRLTSWQWVFNGVNAAAIFLVIFFGSVALIPFSKISLPIRYPGIFIFLSSFAVCVAFWSEPEVIVDASRYFSQSKYLELYGIGHFLKGWGRNVSAWTDLPLVPFLYGLIFRALGECRLYIQIFTTFLFSMSVVLTYSIGKELWDEETGFIGGMLLLGFPHLLVQTPLMLVDVPTMFFLTLAVFGFIKGLAGKGWVSIISAGLCIFLALFSKYSTWPMLSVLGVIFLVRMKSVSVPPEGEASSRSESGRTSASGARKVLAWRGASILAVAALLAGAFWLYKADVFSEQIKLLMSFQKPGLKRWSESFVSTFLFQTHPFIIVLALASVWAAAKEKDRNYLIISWLLVLMLVFQIRRIRYVLPLFPMLSLMAAYGCRRIREVEIRRLVVLCIVLSSLTVAYLAYLPFTLKMSAVNLRDAGMFLNTLKEKEIEVFTIAPKEPVLNPAVAVPLLDLYTDKKIIYHYESFAAPPSEDVKTSALRFTWEYRNPAYYEEKGREGEKKAVRVVIAGDLDEVLPLHVSLRTRDYQVDRAFIEEEGVFQHKTFVAVYHRLGAPAE